MSRSQFVTRKGFRLVAASLALLTFLSLIAAFTLAPRLQAYSSKTQDDAETSSAPLVTNNLRSGAIGLAQGQSLRVNVFNKGKVNVPIIMRFYDGQGKALGFQCDGIVGPDHIYSMDLNGDQYADKPPARAEFTASVRVDPSADPTLISHLKLTLEIYENLTGRTVAVYGFR